MEGWPSQCQQVPKEAGSVPEGAPGMGSHLSPVEKLSLVLLFLSLLGGHEPRPQVYFPVDECQGHYHAVSINGYRRVKEDGRFDYRSGMVLNLSTSSNSLLRTE